MVSLRQLLLVMLYGFDVLSLARVTETPQLRTERNFP